MKNSSEDFAETFSNAVLSFPSEIEEAKKKNETLKKKIGLMQQILRLERLQ